MVVDKKIVFGGVCFVGGVATGVLIDHMLLKKSLKEKILKKMEEDEKGTEKED